MRPSAGQLVLPKSVAGAVARTHCGQRHPGLQLDKFSPPGPQAQQGPALDEVCKASSDASLLEALSERRARALTVLRARRLEARTTGPLTLHLARASALENAGIHLHPLYGFCCLPGSGVKGMTRAWAETIWLKEEDDQEIARDRIRRVFGTAGSDSSAAGAVVFHDAWPTSWPRLERDITNNHHVEYYEGKGADRDRAAPGDWEEPNPVSFLALPAGVDFDFAVSPRRSGKDADLTELAAEWLAAALVHAGAGAKTNAGYGRFELLNRPEPPAPTRARRVARHELQLATPAFLAGARQDRDDCRLRPATLRGLLRWWWRTLHAGHLATRDLRELETAIWGSASQGAALSISLTDGAGGQARPYDKNQVKNEHRLPSPEGSPRRSRHARGRNTTIQGLFYASYGMDERRRGAIQRRHYLPEDAGWHVILTARKLRQGQSSGLHGALSADQVLRQGQAALWLLCRYGGVGAKARKGFGSLQDAGKMEWLADPAPLPSRVASPGSGPRPSGAAAAGALESCIREAAAVRMAAGFAKKGATGTARVEDLRNHELARTWRTGWTEPWYALDQVGAAYQAVVKSYETQERLPLGLPRRKLRVPRELRELKRHASPLHWSLTRGADGRFVVRLSAFPSPRLPNLNDSRRALIDAVDRADRQMRDRANRRDDGPPRSGGSPSRGGPPGKGGPPRRGGPPRSGGTPGGGRPQPFHGVTAPPPRPSGLPKARESVEAVLLAERTKKGGWRAKHEASGLAGPIQNWAHVPAGKQPDDRVELEIAYANEGAIAFRWPTSGGPPGPAQNRPGPRRRGQQAQGQQAQGQQAQGQQGRGRRGHGRRRR